jgi:hypothetical protein
VVDGLGLVLAHPDVADFAIEDLRKWQRWEMTDKDTEELLKLESPAGPPASK